VIAGVGVLEGRVDAWRPPRGRAASSARTQPTWRVVRADGAGEGDGAGGGEGAAFDAELDEREMLEVRRARGAARMGKGW